MHAFQTLGSKRICWTPGRELLEVSAKAGRWREASIKVEVALPDLSFGSGGIWTKWRISESEVPTYRFPSDGWEEVSELAQIKVYDTMAAHIYHKYAYLETRRS